MTYAWIRGTDGTQYYVDNRNGGVAGMYKDAGNGGQLFKVGFGGDFVQLYQTEAFARRAIEEAADMTRKPKLGNEALQVASTKSNTKRPKAATKTAGKTTR